MVGGASRHSSYKHIKINRILHIDRGSEFDWRDPREPIMGRHVTIAQRCRDTDPCVKMCRRRYGGPSTSKQASNRLRTNEVQGVSYYSSIHDSHRIFTSQGKWHQKCGGHEPCSCRIRTQVQLACGQALPKLHLPTLGWGGGLLLPYTIVY